LRPFAFAFLPALALSTAVAVPADDPPPGEPALPFFLEGVDLTQPAQHAFRSWPPEAVRDRAYWLPWSWLTFQRANILRQPVLLVLTVPWSHPAQKVMTDTLSDVAVLRVANESVLMVLVNADRRPDIRDRYRTGNIPALNLLLPNGMPMLSQANPSGLALPISLGYVRPDGLIFALQEGKVYFDRWDSVLAGVASAFEERTRQEPPTAAPVRVEASDFLARWLLGNFDADEGAFAPAPRAIVPWLSEYAALRSARGLPALDAPARSALERVVRSPLRDRRDGGLHRLASLPAWGGIQYEKVLEVQARFLREAAMTLRRGESEEVRGAAGEAIGFLASVLERPGGGFHNAQAADVHSADGGGWWTEDRSLRAAPPIDRTPLTGANAMAGAALLRAGSILEDSRALEMGRRAIDQVVEHGVLPGRGALHTLDGVGADRRFLESQAETAFGLVDAHESTGDARVLRAAADVADFALRNLSREGEVALRDSLATGAEIGLLASPRWPIEANLRLARALVRLHHHGLGEGRYLARAGEIVGALAADPASNGVAGIEAALAIEELSREPAVVVVDGPPGSASTEALRRAALRSEVLWTVVRAGDPVAPSRARLSREGKEAYAETPEALLSALRDLAPAAESARP
jgi:uncharacterized protein YyaL (SSP411 family)